MVNVINISLIESMEVDDDAMKLRFNSGATEEYKGFSDSEMTTLRTSIATGGLKFLQILVDAKTKKARLV